ILPPQTYATSRRLVRTEIGETVVRRRWLWSTRLMSGAGLDGWLGRRQLKVDEG
ncbi:hypothetical protein A2U01_0077449, partial [Trifolium medium]|nr:hypothetical protein [Trifolium medium]